MIKILFIGDIHVKLSALKECYILLNKIIDIIHNEKPDRVVISGDMHDGFSKMHLQEHECIKAWFDQLSAECDDIVYVVGNHDMISGAEHNYNLHWFNEFRSKARIIDDLLLDCRRGINVLYSPYFAPGEFIKEYQKRGHHNDNIRCVFSHQEYFGTQLGPIKSTKGDVWPLDYPMVFNGHIHERGYDQPNIFNVGSPRYTTFSETSPRSVSIIEIDETSILERPIYLNMPRKHTFVLKVDQVKDQLSIIHSVTTEDSFRLIIQDTQEKISAYKTTEEYQNLINVSSLKVVTKVITKPLTKNSKIKTFQEYLYDDILKNRPSAVNVLEETIRAFKG